MVDGRKKSSSISLKICSDEVQVILMCGNLENLRKTFFNRKKSQLLFSKSGGFLFKFRRGNQRFFESLAVLGSYS